MPLKSPRLAIAAMLIAALTGWSPGPASAQTQDIPAWLQRHVGTGEGQIAPVVFGLAPGAEPDRGPLGRFVGLFGLEVGGGVGVGPERPVSLSAGGFLRPALRTGRATSTASGSPRVMSLVRVLLVSARSTME